MEPAEPALPADEGHAIHDLGPEHLDGAAHLHLPVVGRDHQRASGREHVEHVTDQPVGGPQLVVVEIAQPLGVGDLVDALVVGVDERRPGRRQTAYGR